MNQSMLVFTVLLNSLVFGCDLGSQLDNQPTSTVIDGISYALSLERVVFNSTDTVKGELVVTNVTTQSIELQFPNQHALQWRLLDSGDREILTYPTGWFPAFSYLTLAAGEEKSYAFAFALRDRHDVGVNSGTYRFEAGLAREGSPYLQKQIYVQ